MGKLSQKDLVNSRLYEEGIRSMLRKAAQTGLERAVKVGKGIGTAMAPKTSEALGKLGKAVSSDFVKVMGANPKNGLRSWLNTPEGMRLFKTVSLGGEKKLQNSDVEIRFKGQYIDPLTPDVAKDKTGKFVVRPEGEGQWGVMGANDDEGNVIWAPVKDKVKDTDKDRGGDEPAGPEAPVDAPDSPEPPAGIEGPAGREGEVGQTGARGREGQPGRAARVGPDEPSRETVSTPRGAKGAFKTYKDAIKSGVKGGVGRAARDRGIHPDQLVKKGDDYLRDRGLQPGQVGKRTSDWVDDKLDGEDPKLPPPLPGEEPKTSAGARGRKGTRGPKSDSKSSAARRITRALKANRPPSREDLEMLKKAGVKGNQKIGGVTLRNLARRRKLADSFSQRDLLRQLTLLSR